MNNWKDRIIRLGNLKVGKKKEIIFKRLNTEKEIKSLTSSCGCSKPIYNHSKEEIIVIYIPGKIPYHLVSQGYYITSKTITVLYMDGTKDILTFRAKIEA